MAIYKIKIQMFITNRNPKQGKARKALFVIKENSRWIQCLMHWEHDNKNHVVESSLEIVS